MKKVSLVLFVGIVGFAIAQLGCMDRQPAPVCPVPTELKTDSIQTGAFDGVDLLVMVDNSGSMAEEQAILATGFFTLVNSLATPTPTWPYEAVENIRIAVVSSNMGVSYGEDRDIPDDGDVPPSLLQASAHCEGNGDDGDFQSLDVGSVEVASGVIACDESAAQCPSGWTCGDIDDETQTGTCQSGTPTVGCPGLSTSWAETEAGEPNAELNAQAACLAMQSTSGCGFEQQLQSVAVALTKDGQTDFMKDSHLLTVLLVTDEEDCSMEDAPALFGTEECEDATMLNIACNVDEDNEQYLFDVEYFYEAFTEAKGAASAVIFAAIAGVPYGDQDGANECQGQGDTLGNCLDQDAMEMVPYEDDSGSNTVWKFTPACTRSVDGNLVTSAVPGRRYVTLANDYFNTLSYVYSICNPDWSPAMEQVARLIAAQIGGTCYDKPLDWDAATKVAKCNVVAAFTNPEDDECPFELDEGAEATIETETGNDGNNITTVYCPLPKIPAELNCDDNDDEDLAGFGWYYCENTQHEDNPIACNDNVDNDGDGATDCDDTGDADDPGCNTCPICGGNNSECQNICPYNVTITQSAKQILLGAPVTVQCLQQFSFEDGNCQEDSHEACNDGEDNDGNGIYDCTNVTAEEDPDHPHLADPHCCPMRKLENGDCDMNVDGVGGDDYQDICDATDYGAVDACVRAKEILGCSW